jgi:hypothetical protein
LSLDAFIASFSVHQQKSELRERLAAITSQKIPRFDTYSGNASIYAAKATLNVDSVAAF